MKRFEYIDVTSEAHDQSMGLSYVDPITCQTFWRRPPDTYGAKARYLVRRINYDAKIAHCVPYEDATPEEKASNLRVYGGEDIHPWD